AHDAHHARCLDVEAAPALLGDLDLLVAVHPPALGELAQTRGRDVVPDVVDEVQAVALAVLGGVGDAGLDRLGDGAGLHRLAAHVEPAGDVAPVGAAEDAHRELGAACAHEPGDPDDLARADGEARPVDDLAVLRGVPHRPVLDAQHLLTGVGLALRVEALD